MKISEQVTRVKKKWLLIVAIAAVVITVSGFVVYGLTTNFAHDIAKPIEQSLKEAGAKKICDRGGSGRGVDNKTPWYQSYYAVPKGESDAVSLMYSSAEKAGYGLKHATPEARGPLEVGDEFIAKWYYDYDKSSTYDQLKEGKISLAMTVNADGTESSCSEKITVDQSSSVISIQVRLPEYR